MNNASDGHDFCVDITERPYKFAGVMHQKWCCNVHIILSGVAKENRLSYSLKTKQVVTW